MSFAPSSASIPSQAGIGLRFPHVEQLLETRPSVAWLELLTDNHLVIQKQLPEKIEALRHHYPMALHGVGLNLGGADPLDKAYLGAVKQLATQLEIAHISEHCCFTAHNGEQLHDLLPLPFTIEAVKHVASRITQAQDYLGQQILIENLSSYLAFENAEMSEAEFITEVATRADCLLLVDINNLVVNQINHGWDARQAIQSLPSERIQEFHLAGHSQVDNGALHYAIDTHDNVVSNDVWALFETAVATHGNRPSLVEWDQNIPALDRLLNEASHAQTLLTAAVTPAAASN